MHTQTLLDIPPPTQPPPNTHILTRIHSHTHRCAAERPRKQPGWDGSPGFPSLGHFPVPSSGWEPACDLRSCGWDHTPGSRKRVVQPPALVARGGSSAPERSCHPCPAQGAVPGSVFLSLRCLSYYVWGCFDANPGGRAGRGPIIYELSQRSSHCGTLVLSTWEMFNTPLWNEFTEEMPPVPPAKRDLGSLRFRGTTAKCHRFPAWDPGCPLRSLL